MSRLANEATWLAARALVSEEPMRQRLGHAYDALARLQPTDLPEILRGTFLEIMDDLAGVVRHSSARGTQIRLVPSSARRAAHRIFDLYVALEARKGRGKGD